MDNIPPERLAIPDEKRAQAKSRSWFARNWIWVVALLLVLAALSPRVILYVGYIAEDKRTAARLIEQFHGRMNAGQFDQIYDDFHPTFKNRQTREAAIKSMQDVRDQFGEFKGVSDSEMNVLFGPIVEVRGAYNSKFEKGDATELFVFFRGGLKLELAFYQISPGTSKLEWKHSSEGQQAPGK